jgi:DNA-binding NarL/FixJ family response regulator
MGKDRLAPYDRDMIDGPLTHETPRGRPLSRRELEVVALAARGLGNKAIAEHLGVSVHSVKFHLAGVYRKLGVDNRTQATVEYLSSLGDGDRAEHGAVTS